MKKSDKKNKYRLGIYCLFAVSLAASLCGTFAWYTYGTRVPVYYNGISIGDYGSLEIGLICYKSLSKAEINAYALTEQKINDSKYIYWSTGSFQSEPLKLIQKLNGYANEFTHPVTAGRYDETHTEFHLRNCPTENKLFLGDDKWAPIRDFNRLELAFRYKASDGESVDENGNVIHTEVSYATEFNVLLTSCSALSSDGNRVHEALRIYYEDASGKGHLINPNKYESSVLNAGGRLNMGRDAYYDVEPKEIGKYYEFAYGEWEEGELVYNTEPYPELEEGEEMLPNPTNPMTFDAEPYPGAYGIDYSKSTFPKIKFEGKNAFNNSDIPLSQPKGTNQTIAYCDIYIYLEGWDPALDNQEALNDFSFQLQFEAH